MASTETINAQNFPTEIDSIVMGSGDATDADVRAGKTYSNDSGASTGTMPNGTAKVPDTTEAQSQPSITISDTGLITASVEKKEITISPEISVGYISLGTSGKVTMDENSNIKQLTTLDTKCYAAKTSDQTIPAGTYLTGDQIFRAVEVPDASAILKGNSVSSDGVTIVNGSMPNNGTVTVEPDGNTGYETIDITDGYTTAVRVNRTTPYNAGYVIGQSDYKKQHGWKCIGVTTCGDEGGSHTFSATSIPNYTSLDSGNFIANMYYLKTTTGGNSYEVNPTISYNASTGTVTYTWGVMTGTTWYAIQMYCVY